MILIRDCKRPSIVHMSYQTKLKLPEPICVYIRFSSAFKALVRDGNAMFGIVVTFHVTLQILLFLCFLTKIKLSTVVKNKNASPRFGGTSVLYTIKGHNTVLILCLCQDALTLSVLCVRRCDFLNQIFIPGDSDRKRTVPRHVFASRLLYTRFFLLDVSAPWEPVTVETLVFQFSFDIYRQLNMHQVVYFEGYIGDNSLTDGFSSHRVHFWELRAQPAIRWKTVPAHHQLVRLLRRCASKRVPRDVQDSP